MSEKIDMSLSNVTGLLEHDVEMDDIADKAIKSYEALCDLGLNVPEMHTGKIYEVASTMLKTAMEAKDAKVQKKLKMLDLQLKKLKIDSDINPEILTSGGNGVEFDRNGSAETFAGLSLRGGISTVDTADVLVWGFQVEQSSFAG